MILLLKWNKINCISYLSFYIFRNSPDYGLSPLIVTSMKLQERPKGPVRSRANSISSTSSVLPTKYSHSSSRRNSNSDHNNKKSSNPPSRKNSLVQNNIPLHVAAAAAGLYIFFVYIFCLFIFLFTFFACR